MDDPSDHSSRSVHLSISSDHSWLLITWPRRGNPLLHGIMGESPLVVIMACMMDERIDALRMALTGWLDTPSMIALMIILSVIVTDGMMDAITGILSDGLDPRIEVSCTEYLSLIVLHMVSIPSYWWYYWRRYISCWCIHYRVSILLMIHTPYIVLVMYSGWCIYSHYIRYAAGCVVSSRTGYGTYDEPRPLCLSATS